MKKIAVAIAITLTALGAYLYQRGTPPAQAIVAQGTVRAVSSVQVRATLDGQVKEIAADFRTPVKSGQILARIDAAAYEKRVDQARADLEAARAAKAPGAIKQREALLKQAEIDLERTAIRAPVDGTVILRNTGVGQMVAAGPQAPALFAIAPDLRTVQVEAVLDEAQARRLRPGMSAIFSVDALPRRSFTGEIRDIRKGRTYTVVIAVSNPDLALLPGMTANVRIPRAP